MIFAADKPRNIILKLLFRNLPFTSRITDETRKSRFYRKEIPE